ICSASRSITASCASPAGSWRPTATSTTRSLPSCRHCSSLSAPSDRVTMALMLGRLRTIAVVVLLAPSLAIAQPSAKDKQEASDLVKRAIAKSQSGDHETAVQLYLDAYKIIPQPLLLSNIGSEYQQMNKKV